MLQLVLGTKEMVAQVTRWVSSLRVAAARCPCRVCPSARHGILTNMSQLWRMLWALLTTLGALFFVVAPLFFWFAVCHTPGIILKRQAKPTGRDVSRRKPSDLASLADSVQKLCQVALPLARSLEFLHEDVDSMSKEYRCVRVCGCVRIGMLGRGAQAVCEWSIAPWLRPPRAEEGLAAHTGVERLCPSKPRPAIVQAAA